MLVTTLSHRLLGGRPYEGRLRAGILLFSSLDKADLRLTVGTIPSQWRAIMEAERSNGLSRRDIGAI